MSNRVKVEIYGQSYTLSGDLDEDYVQRLARYVDEKMNAVSEATQTVDSVRVAVLAAMAIADELHTRQHRYRPSRRRVARARPAVPDYPRTSSQSIGLRPGVTIPGPRSLLFAATQRVTLYLRLIPR